MKRLFPPCSLRAVIYSDRPVLIVTRFMRGRHSDLPSFGELSGLSGTTTSNMAARAIGLNRALRLVDFRSDTLTLPSNEILFNF